MRVQRPRHMLCVSVDDASDESNTMKIREVAFLGHYEEVIARSSRQ